MKSIFKFLTSANPARLRAAQSDRGTRESLVEPQQVKLENSHHSVGLEQDLIVAWNKDAGNLSPKVLDYLNELINTDGFCEIEPMDFFSLAGVTIEKNIAQFPEGKFFCIEKNNLLIFKGSEPELERYGFLNAISDFAQRYGKIKHLYTISGTISSTAHTNPRQILTVFNQHEFQKELRRYGLKDITWQGTPAINNYLLWIAKRKGIPGVNLLTQIPFYLAACEDFQAIKLTLSFLDKRFNLELDLKELDEHITRQNIKLNRLRQKNSEVDKHIRVLESGLFLSEEEQFCLIKAVSEFLEFGKS